MNKQSIFILLIIMLTSMMGTKAFAYDIAVPNADGVTIYYLWSNNNTELSVTYSGQFGSYSGNVVIPESIDYEGNTYNVTSIDMWSFRFCTGLTSVTIGNNVKTIGTYAFMLCENLTSITIPSSVISFGSRAFQMCTSLNSIYISDLAAWCSRPPVDHPGIQHFYLNDEEIKDLVIPSSVTSIGDDAFYSFWGLTSVSIPSSVTTIGVGAFAWCSNITSAVIGNNVTTIGERAFHGCSNLTSITIGDNVTNIGEMAFCGCSGLTSVTIPNSVSSIGEYAFGDCCGLTSVTIPNSVISLDALLFVGCYNLTSITIGSGVTKIGSFAFKDCSSLTNVYCYAESVPTIDKSAFDGSNVGNATLYVPNGTKHFYEHSDVWIKFKEIIELNAIKGDVTGDGKVTKEDITEVETEILEPSVVFDPNKDVNRDGVVNVADIVEVVNIINSHGQVR